MIDIASKAWSDILNSIYKGSFRFQNPELLWLLIPIVIILLFFMTRSFVRIDKKRLSDPKWISSRRRYRIFIFFSRLLIFSLLVVALADPFGEIRSEIPGDLTLHLLVDESDSLGLYDLSFVDGLKSELEKLIPVKTEVIASPTESRIGDGILSSLQKDRNILLISDGRNTRGTNLLDVMLYAATLNSSVSAIRLDQINEDVSVVVRGPSKTISGVENNYRVLINRVALPSSGLGPVRLTVGVDNDVIFDGMIEADHLDFKYNFSDGYHRIVARISLPEWSSDFFPENNVFYMTTHVVPKPKILFVTRTTSALDLVLKELYDVVMSDVIPDSLDEYYAVVLNDMPLLGLRNVDRLTDYVIEGNGLFVVGGYNSFDNGDYKGSSLESLLPVVVGTGQKHRGDANIVIVIDISGSTGFQYGSAEKAVNVEKALALSVINDINEGNSVGVVAFNDKAYKVADLEPLFVSKAQTIDKLSRLIDGGPTTLNVGVRGAFEMLRGKTGSKNVVWITDGITLDKIDLAETENIVRAMNEYGIKLYIIGTGRNANEEYLSRLGRIGSGFYLKATDANRLKILFGEPEKKDMGTAFGLFILDSNHFITEELSLDAVLYGYNQVVPKANANLLITSDSGEPAVTVWRHGIGRVAALTVFSSGNNLGELLDKKNSMLITRITNWLIADPERKNDFFVNVENARANKTSFITVRSQSFPKVKGLEFSKVDKNTYRAPYLSETVGFKGVLNAVFGVNYDYEYQLLGINPELDALVDSTKGKVFSPNQASEIVEHVKSVSKRFVIERTSFRNFFIALALCLLVLEFIMRRVKETWFR